MEFVSYMTNVINSPLHFFTRFRNGKIYVLYMIFFSYWYNCLIYWRHLRFIWLYCNFCLSNKVSVNNFFLFHIYNLSWARSASFSAITMLLLRCFACNWLCSYKISNYIGRTIERTTLFMNYLELSSKQIIQQ